MKPLRVRLLWWSSVSGDPSRGNRIAFENIGVQTELLTQNIMPQVHLQYGADFIFTGMIYEMLNWAGMGFLKLPVVIQGGGYGPYFLPDGKIDRNFEKVTDIPQSIVTVLDPNYYLEMQKSGLEFDYEQFFLVPNGLTMTLTKFPMLPQKRSEDEFVILNPSGNFWIKNPQKFIEATKLVFKEEPKIKFQFPIKTRYSYNAPIKWLDCENVELMPIKSQPQLYMLYQKADVVGVYSEAEILPTHVFEALWFDKPLIHSHLGMLQSVPSECLGEMTKDFGMSIPKFHEKWKGEYLKGDHFKYVKSPKEFAESCIELYNNEEERKALAKRGSEWKSSWWMMEDKAQLLVDMLQERKFVGGG